MVDFDEIPTILPLTHKRVKYPFVHMHVGEELFMIATFEEQVKIRSAVGRLNERLNRKYSCRADCGGISVHRVW